MEPNEWTLQEVFRGPEGPDPAELDRIARAWLEDLRERAARAEADR